MYDGIPAAETEAVSPPESPASGLSDWDQKASGSSTGGGLKQARKTRVALACKRCKRRKQRCDGGHPGCRSCERAGVTCLYEKTIRPQYPGGKSLYINALEERIAFLEARLPAHAQDHFEAPSMEARLTGELWQGGTLYDSAHGHSQTEPGNDEEQSSLVDGVAYLSLRASGTTDTAPDPFYLGSSSGATIARMVQSAIFRGSSGRAISQAIAANRVHQAEPEVPLLSVPLSVQPDGSLSEFPFPEQARLLFDVFFDRLHTRWPILNRKEYSLLFEKQYEKGVLSIVQRSMMHLIYAISARFLQLTQKPCGVDHDRHLIAAIEPMDYILEQHNLATVQFLLLLAVHGQRSPYGAGAWSQVRYAVSLCIELGLHRKRRAPSSAHEAQDNEIRRRAFWSCYCLDRGTSVVLGRAFAITDRDINVELPSMNVKFWSLTHKGQPDISQAEPWSNIAPFIHIIELERIQSRIHRAVFRVDKDVFAGPLEQRAKLDEKMAQIMADLDTWIRTIPYQPKESKKIIWMYDPESAKQDSRDFFMLQYHKTVLSLFTVLLPSLDSIDSRFITSARSAGCVCIAYKRLNQQKTLSYTMISLHSCFVAGLTLMYCLWRDRSLFSFDVLEASRACSQSLTIFGEKWPGAIKYRDIFDALSGSLLKSIVNPATAAYKSEQAGPQPLRIDLDGNLGPGSEQLQATQSNETRSQSHAGSTKPTMIHMVTDAVKEAFMEVDEEAPGGWQGWRMWNEMVSDNEHLPDNGYLQAFEDPEAQQPLSWQSGQENDFQAHPMFNESVTQSSPGLSSGQYRTMDTATWNFGELGRLP